MPIIFAIVARGPAVLAKYASCAGNFSEVTDQILAKISPENAKLTYSHGNYLFHYVSDDRIIYLCITDDDFERSRAFMFLNEIKRRFCSMYGARALTALPYSMNSEFSKVLASQIRHFSENRDVDQITKVQDEVDELKGIMVKNIDNIASRGEKLQLLVEKAEGLENHAVSFKKSSRNLARSLWWKNIKLTVVIGIVIIIIIYFIVSAACGGLNWPNCVR